MLHEKISYHQIIDIFTYMNPMTIHVNSYVVFSGEGFPIKIADEAFWCFRVLLQDVILQVSFRFQGCRANLANNICQDLLCVGHDDVLIQLFLRGEAFSLAASCALELLGFAFGFWFIDIRCCYC